MNPNVKSLFVLIFIIAVIALFAGGAVGEADLTPDTPPAPRVSDALHPVAGGLRTCDGPYTVLSGDTLSRLAQNCRISLDALLMANPDITNPNLISVGQVIYIPKSEPAVVSDADVAQSPAPESPDAAAQGSPADESEGSTTAGKGFRVGDSITLLVRNFPPEETIKLRAGPRDDLLEPYLEYLTDAQGNCTIVFVVPDEAVPGETWVIMVETMRGEPEIQMTTQPFLIIP